MNAYAVLYGTPPTQYITLCSPGTAVVSAPSLVPELVGWLAGCLAVLCSCQRQSLLLGSVVSHYGDLARTKMGAKNTHELWDMKFESVAVPD